jgi:hypothetical protein
VPGGDRGHLAGDRRDLVPLVREMRDVEPDGAGGGRKQLLADLAASLDKEPEVRVVGPRRGRTLRGLDIPQSLLRHLIE